MTQHLKHVPAGTYFVKPEDLQEAAKALSEGRTPSALTIFQKLEPSQEVPKEKGTVFVLWGGEITLFHESDYVIPCRF